MILASLRATALLLMLCCFVYPVTVTVIGQLAFHDAANGSLVYAPDGSVVGSSLVGQGFSTPAYLQGRPSAAGAGYDASSSSGSNLGPTSRKLASRRAAERTRLINENPDSAPLVPEILLTASGSGLDPHLPPDAAKWQLPRIALARGVELHRVEAILSEHVAGRDLGFLGEPHVNVLTFNIALDHRLPVAK